MPNTSRNAYRPGMGTAGGTPPAVARARVEAFHAALATRNRVPTVLTYGDEPDLECMWSPYPVSAANLISQAHIPPADAARRAAEVNEPYFDRGLPFAWLLTPDTSSPELEDALAAAGLARSTSPEMYADLPAPVPVELPADVVIEPTDDADELAEAIGAGFGFGDGPGVIEGLAAYLRGLQPGLCTALLALDEDTGDVLGVGNVFHVDDMVQLVNIATVKPARGRGIGAAMTASLMNLARDLGADAAVLTATEMGYPLYVRYGFVTVFELVRYEWIPPARD